MFSRLTFMTKITAAPKAHGFLASYFQLLLKHEWSWEKFKKDYRSLCARIQKRYGFQASIPFNIEEVNEFLDRKESTIHRRNNLVKIMHCSETFSFDTRTDFHALNRSRILKNYPGHQRARITLQMYTNTTS